MPAVAMDRRRAMLWALLLGSILFTSYTLWSRDGTPAAGTPVAATADDAAAPAPPAPAPAPVEPTPPLAEAEFDAWRQGLGAVTRDPFFTVEELEARTRPDLPAPVAEAAPDAPPYTLKLVLATGATRRALIGERVVEVGDMLGMEKVVDIQPRAVVLERNGARRRIDLVSSAAAGDVRLERHR